jgi:hypothetical protein
VGLHDVVVVEQGGEVGCGGVGSDEEGESGEMPPISSRTHIWERKKKFLTEAAALGLTAHEYATILADSSAGDGAEEPAVDPEIEQAIKNVEQTMKRSTALAAALEGVVGGERIGQIVAAFTLGSLEKDLGVLRTGSAKAGVDGLRCRQAIVVSKVEDAFRSTEKLVAQTRPPQPPSRGRQRERPAVWSGGWSNRAAQNPLPTKELTAQQRDRVSRVVKAAALPDGPPAHPLSDAEGNPLAEQCRTEGGARMWVIKDGEGDPVAAQWLTAGDGRRKGDTWLAPTVRGAQPTQGAGEAVAAVMATQGHGLAACSAAASQIWTAGQAGREVELNPGRGRPSSGGNRTGSTLVRVPAARLVVQSGSPTDRDLFVLSLQDATAATAVVQGLQRVPGGDEDLARVLAAAEQAAKRKLEQRAEAGGFSTATGHGSPVPAGSPEAKRAEAQQTASRRPAKAGGGQRTEAPAPGSGNGKDSGNSGSRSSNTFRALVGLNGEDDRTGGGAAAGSPGGGDDGGGGGGGNRRGDSPSDDDDDDEIDEDDDDDDTADDSDSDSESDGKDEGSAEADESDGEEGASEEADGSPEASKTGGATPESGGGGGGGSSGNSSSSRGTSASSSDGVIMRKTIRFGPQEAADRGGTAIFMPRLKNPERRAKAQGATQRAAAGPGTTSL